MIIAITLITALITYLIFRQVKRAKADKVLIEFKIGTIDGFYYNIEAQKIPIKMDSDERVRLMIGFVVKLLAYAHKNDRNEKQDILKFLNKITKKELSSKAINDYFKREFAFEPDVRQAEAKGKIISGRFLTRGQEREFRANMPSILFKYQLLFSIASLLSFVIGRLDSNRITVLQQSLKYIADAYLNNISNPTNGSDIINLENTAYRAGNSQTQQAKLKVG